MTQRDSCWFVRLGAVLITFDLQKRPEKHSVFGLNLTAHDTQLITGSFEKNPQTRMAWNRHLRAEKTQSHLCISWSSKVAEVNTLTLDFLFLFNMPQHFTNSGPSKNHRPLKWNPEDTNIQSHTRTHSFGLGGRSEGGSLRWKMALKKPKNGRGGRGRGAQIGRWSSQQ